MGAYGFDTALAPENWLACGGGEMIRCAGGPVGAGCDPGAGAYRFGGGAPDGGAVNGDAPRATGGTMGVGRVPAAACDCCGGGAYAFSAVELGRCI